MNQREVSFTIATIAGRLVSSIIIAGVISLVVYALRSKKGLTKQQKRGMFFEVFVPAAIVVFIVEYILLITQTGFF